MPRLRDEPLLLLLLLAFPPLFWAAGEAPGALPGLVDWKTIGALTGLMILSRGLEDSGGLERVGRRIVARAGTERWLATLLVLLSALLSAAITNDVTLFVVVPLTVAIGRRAGIPVGRLVVFLALAVNAGSAVSPVGNPQNLFLWQTTGVSFGAFVAAMLPLSAALLALLLVLVPLAFRATPLRATAGEAPLRRPLLIGSLALYLPFLVATDAGYAVPAAVLVLALYAVLAREVPARVDWPLLVVFLMMFLDLGLLARIDAVAAVASGVQGQPLATFATGALLSQAISNVPATLFLAPFTDEWRPLAWGATVGGFGLLIGSLANLIALRLAGNAATIREFHLWSVPMFFAAALIGWVLL